VLTAEITAISDTFVADANLALQSHLATSAARWPSLRWSIQSHQNAHTASCILSGFLPASQADWDEVTVSLTAQARDGVVELTVDACVGPKVGWNGPTSAASTEIEVRAFIKSALAAISSI
jgi:hypothetical protein